MTSPIRNLIIVIILVIAAFVAVCNLFETPFADTTVDWFAFFAGIFLAFEAIYKMLKFKSPFFPQGLFRLFRIIIGLDIFIVHLLQHTLGVDCEILASPFKQAFLDWSAFLFGLFLMIEGSWRIFTRREAAFTDQFTRILRVTIGACIFTIHLLQFMR